ncbi:MAG: hypothetical protein ACW97X_03060 [Candidatus Hodarchaeales archaeon]|jgi:hypothetical protein
MSLSVTQIKLYGPGISNGLNKLEELDKNREFGDKIKRSGLYIGEEADFELLWAKTPSPDDTLELVKHLDDIFQDCECRYTVSTNLPKVIDILTQLEQSKEKDLAFTFIRLIGPSVSQAIEVLNENISNFLGVKNITGELIGRFDYAFEWVRIPETNDISRLSTTLDQVLKDTGVIFTISTKSKTRIFNVPQVPRDRTRTDPIQFVLHRKV